MDNDYTHRISKELDGINKRLIMLLCKLMNVVKDKTITFVEPIKVMHYNRNTPAHMLEVKTINGGLFDGVAKLSMEVVNLTDENKEQTIGYKKATTWSASELSCESLMALVWAIERHIINTASVGLDDYLGKRMVANGLNDYLENEHFPSE